MLTAAAEEVPARAAALDAEGGLGAAVCALPRHVVWMDVPDDTVLLMVRRAAAAGGVGGVGCALAATGCDARRANWLLRRGGPVDRDVMTLARGAACAEEAAVALRLLWPLNAQHLAQELFADNRCAPFLSALLASPEGVDAVLTRDICADEMADPQGLLVHGAVPAASASLGAAGCLGRLLGYAVAARASDCVAAAAASKALVAAVDGCYMSGSEPWRHALVTAFVCLSRHRRAVDRRATAAAFTAARFLCSRARTPRRERALAYVLACGMGMRRVAQMLPPECSMHELFEAVCRVPLAGLAYWKPELDENALAVWRMCSTEDPLGVAQRVFHTQGLDARRDASVVAALVVRRAVLDRVPLTREGYRDLRLAASRAAKHRLAALCSALHDWIQVNSHVAPMCALA